MAPKITAIETQKKNPNRVNIYLDGEFSFGLSRVVAAWVRVGQEITDEDIKHLKALDAVEVAMQRALNFLSYRDRTEQEIRKNLQKHGHDDNVIQKVINKLEEMGLINDRKFAQSWVENRKEFHPRSRKALAIELARKGIDQNVINETLESVDDYQMAYTLANRQLHRYQGLEFHQFRQKLGSYLARYGFSYYTASRVIQDIWENQRKQQPNIDGTSG